MANRIKSAGDRKLSDSTLQTGNVATLSGGFRPSGIEAEPPLSKADIRQLIGLAQQIAGLANVLEGCSYELVECARPDSPTACQSAPYLAGQVGFCADQILRKLGSVQTRRNVAWLLPPDCMKLQLDGEPT